MLLLQNLLAENGDEEEEEQKEDVEDVRVVMRAFDDALFIVDNIVFGCENAAFVVLIRCVCGIEEESISESLLNCAEKVSVTTSFASLSEHEDEKGCT